VSIDNILGTVYNILTRSNKTDLNIKHIQSTTTKQRKAGNNMKNIMNSFTQEELQLLYAACMSYGDKLSEIIKSIPNEETDKLSDRAKDSWNLARKITEYME